MAAQEDGTASSSGSRAAGPPSPQQEGAVGSGRGRHSNIYVRGLPEACSEERLLALVAPYGTVQSVRIYHAQKTMSYGAKCTFSFVKFSTVQEAQAAITGLDGIEFGGNVLQARLAVRDVDTAALSTTANKPPASDNIYCKNLPSSLRESELRAVFSAYGTIVSCRILRQGNATGLGGAALIRFSHVDEASAAVEVLQGTRFPGSLHPLVIRFADTEEVKERKIAERQGLMGSEGDDPIARSKDRADRGRAREQRGPSHGQDPPDLLQGSGSRGPGDAGASSSSAGIGRGIQGQGQGMRGDGHGGGSGTVSSSGVPAVSFWQPPYNPYSSLDAQPRDMSAAAFMPSGGGGGGGGGPGARYPGPEAFPWHAFPVQTHVFAMPHTHTQPLMMMAEAGGAAPGAAATELAAAVGGVPVARAPMEGHGRGMLGASGREGRGVGLAYGQVSDSGGGGGGGGGGAVYHQHMAEGHGGDPGAAASGSFVSVRYAPMVHPGYMHVPQMTAQLPGSAMPVTGTFFPQGASSVQLGTAPGSWRMAQAGAAGGGGGSSGMSGGAAVPVPSAGPVPPFPAHVLHTVFCSNLPDQADRLYLYECFAPFGAILSVKLLKDKKGNSRRAAFINYADAAGASRAVAAMNNLPVGASRHLHVSLRNPF